MYWVNCGPGDQVRRAALRDNRTEFGVLLKLVTLIKMCLIENYNTVRLCKQLWVKLRVRNDLKQVDVTTLACQTLRCGVRRVQGKQMELKLNGKTSASGLKGDISLLDEDVNKLY